MPIQDRDSNNSVQVTYTRGLDLAGSLQGAGGIGGLLAMTLPSTINSPPSTYYYHADGSGNITSLIDAQQNIVARYLYDPFGRLISKSGALADVNRYQFSSKEIHSNSGLYYYGFRFYDPSLQRWLNQDPIGENGGVNVYGFLGNNAQNGVDPFGLDKNLPPGGNEFQPFPYFAPNMAIVSVVDPPPPKPSFGVSLIPVYGSWRSAAYESGQGNSFLAVFHTGMAVTDVALVKSAVVGLGKLGFKAGCKLLGLGGEKALEEIAAKEAGEQAVERLITREINKHHSFPKFLGGNLKQILSELSPAIHREFHQLLRQNLKEAGFPLDAANASAADWARYFAANPGAQEAAVKALAKTSFAIDAKYGTSITQDLLNNIGAANFTAH